MIPLPAVQPYSTDAIVRPSERAVQLHEETTDRLDRLREDGQSHDEVINELVTIYLTLEQSMAHSGDTL